MHSIVQSLRSDNLQEALSPSPYDWFNWGPKDHFNGSTVYDRVIKNLNNSEAGKTALLEMEKVFYGRIIGTEMLREILNKGAKATAN